VEARGQVPRGEYLGGVKVKRGSASRTRVKPGLVVRTDRMRKPSKPRRGIAMSDLGLSECYQLERQTAWRESDVERRSSLPGRESLCRPKAQGRYQHETRLEGERRRKASGD